MPAPSAISSACSWQSGADVTHVETIGQLTEKASSPILSVNSVCAAYDHRVVLNNIDCAISEKQITAILGPSGCGKSTLLRVFNRTLELIPGGRLLAGTVSFRGRNLYGVDCHPMTIRRHIGLIHQRPVPFPMTILDDVLLGARYHKLLGGAPPVEYARCYLELVGLWNEVKDRLRDRAERLSGGQQQRLCLARTLANQPKMILMDEPCSSLDPTATKQIEELVLELKKRYPIVIVTHNLSQANRIADRAIFMYAGAIIESGPKEQLFTRPKSRLTADFVSGRMG